MTTKRINAKTTEQFLERELRAVEKALRRIVRANDLRSKALAKSIGLTIPQLVVLKAIARLGEVTTTAVSVHVDLSAATVVTILDNLEARHLVLRYRSQADRRVVHTKLTPAGMELINQALEPLGEKFAARFARLSSSRRATLVGALDEVADLMQQDGPAPHAGEVRNSDLLDPALVPQSRD